MKKTFTKLFVAFLALLLAPNSLWAQDALTVSETAVDVSADVANVLANDEFNTGKVSYTASTKTLTLADGATLTSIVNNSVDGLQIYIAQNSTVTLESLTCNAAVTVYGGGTLNVSNDSGIAVTIGEEGTFTIGKNGQTAPMNVSITSSSCCISFDDNIETVAFTVIGSYVTLTGTPTNANGFDGEDEDAVAAYIDCTLDLSADPITITPTAIAPVADAIGDVFYTETTVSDGTLRIPYTVLTLADGETPGGVMFGLAEDDYVSEPASYTGDGQIDFTIPESVTSPNGFTYNVTEGGSINTDFNNSLSFIKTLTIPAILKKFNNNFLGGIAAKIDEKAENEEAKRPGLEKVIFADGSVQDDITTGDMNTAFMTAFVFDDSFDILETDAVELVIPADWDDVQNDWGEGKWYGDKVVSPVHYEIWIDNYGNENGIEVTSLNQDDVLDDGGSITYDPDTKELTLTKDIARISNGETGFIDMRPGVDGLKIVIPEGETVTISMDGMEGMEPAISVNNNTIITGGGTLNVKHRINDVIQIGGTHQDEPVVAGNLTVKDVTMNVYAIGSTAQAIVFANSESSLVVNSAALNLECQDGGNEGPAEDVVMYGLAGNEPTFINCAITTPTPAPTWAALTGYWNTNVTDEAYRVYGYQVSALTIEPVAAFSADVQDGSYDGVTVELEQVGETDKVIISGVATGDDATGVVVIPATVTVGDASFTVASIGDNAFEGQTNLSGVTLPQTLTSIGAEAFKDCGTINEVTFLGTVPTISDNVFSGTIVGTVKYPAAAKSTATDTKLTAVGATTTSPCVFTSKEWTTLYSGVDFTLPNDVEAYIVTNVDFTTGKLTVAATTGKVRAGTPLLLRKQPAGDDMYPITSFADVDISGAGTPCSEFKGSTEPVNIENNATKQYYILMNGQFVKATDGTLPAFKCYILSEQTLGAPALSIEIQDDETTGISDVRGNTDDVTGEWYDLSGRKLQSKPTQKGVYIINGKKIRVK